MHHLKSPSQKHPLRLDNNRNTPKKYQTNGTAVTGTLRHHNEEVFIVQNSHSKANDKGMGQYVCHNNSTITESGMLLEKLMIAGRQVRIRVNTVNQQAFVEESNDEVQCIANPDDHKDCKTEKCLQT